MPQVQFTMRELMEAGVHFGHKTKRWNPKMAPFLFGIRHDIHIIDLQQTVPMLKRALKHVTDTVSNNGRVLFVGTKRQSQEIVMEHAKRCGQYYVNNRWLGGMLTNWKTISNSIRRLKDLEEMLNQEDLQLTKNEKLQLSRQKDKLDLVLGGIREMGGLPDVIFVVDTNKEDIAVKEANKLGIPVIGILDSNSDPEGIAFPVPGNDDSARAIDLYCRLISDAVLAGIEQGMIRSGADLGASEKTPAALKKAKAKVSDKPAEKDAAEEAPAEAAADADEKKAAPKAKTAAKAPAKKTKTAKADAEEDAPAKKAAAS